MDKLAITHFLKTKLNFRIQMLVYNKKLLVKYVCKVSPKIQIISYLILVSVLDHVNISILNVYKIGFSLKLKNRLLEGQLIITLINSNARFVDKNYQDLSLEISKPINY